MLTKEVVNEMKRNGKERKVFVRSENQPKEGKSVQKKKEKGGDPCKKRRQP